MSIGIAFSGGGVSAAIGAACAWNSIVELHPHVLDPSIMDLTVSTVSGGSIGYGWWANARERIQFTPYDSNMTLEELIGEQKDIVDPNENELFSDTIKQWFSLDKQPNVTSCNDGKQKKRTVGEIVGDLFSPVVFRQFAIGGEQNGWSHWWRSIIQGIFSILCVDEIKTRKIPWLTAFAFFLESANYDRSNDRGPLLPSSAEALRHVVVDMNNGNFEVSPKTKGKSLAKISPIDAIAYSSAFWSSNILTNNMVNLVFNRMLIKSSTSTFYALGDAEKLDVVIMDGGVVDTTGIVALLKQKKQTIVSFYNNNVPLQLVSSPIAYLFGIDATTDTHNSLKGPSLSQVFPSGLYPDVIRNLTDPNIGVARLENINVVQNQLGVEPYKILSLTIVSNGKVNRFQFEDERISQRISSRWPDHYPYGLPVLGANALCAYSDYKVKNLLKGADNIFQIAET